MIDLNELPPEDFMYDKVDLEFLIDVNVVLHFIKLSYVRLNQDPSHHRVCETFLVLKNLVNKHLPALNEKVQASGKSQADLDEIFGKNRKAVLEAVNKGIVQKNKEKKNGI